MRSHTNAPSPRYDLPWLASDRETQGRIKAQVHALKDRGRKNLFVEVTEKGSKTRVVPVPIDFFVQNLDYIWDQRANFIDGLTARRPNYEEADSMWLSAKTGGALSAKSVANFMGASFRDAGVPGSGHRLRALFAEEVVRDAYLRARAAHGRAWDAASVLLWAAEALGHEDPETLRPYLNRIMREDQLAEGEPVLVSETHQAAKVGAIVTALNDGDQRVEGAIDGLLHDLKLSPEPEHTTLEDVRQRIEKRRARAKT